MDIFQKFLASFEVVLRCFLGCFEVVFSCMFFPLKKFKLPQQVSKMGGGEGVKATYGQCPKGAAFVQDDFPKLVIHLFKIFKILSFPKCKS